VQILNKVSVYGPQHLISLAQSR